MRAALLIACCFAAGALAQAPNLESLARADVRQREAALVALRDGVGLDPALCGREHRDGGGHIGSGRGVLRIGKGRVGRGKGRHE